MSRIQLLKCTLPCLEGKHLKTSFSIRIHFHLESSHVKWYIISIYTYPETNISLLKIGRNPKGKPCLPTIHFPGLCWFTGVSAYQTPAFASSAKLFESSPWPGLIPKQHLAPHFGSTPPWAWAFRNISQPPEVFQRPSDVVSVFKFVKVCGLRVGGDLEDSNTKQKHKYHRITKKDNHYWLITITHIDTQCYELCTPAKSQQQNLRYPNFNAASWYTLFQQSADLRSQESNLSQKMQPSNVCLLEYTPWN